MRYMGPFFRMNNLSQDEIFGKFLTYGELMSDVKPTGDVELNVMWENFS